MRPTHAFTGRPARPSDLVPPGQFITDEFPVLTAGPSPLVSRSAWELIVDNGEESRSFSWEEFEGLPHEQVTVDLHCVTHWSKLNTTWGGVLVSTLFEAASVDTRETPYALAMSYHDYSTNLLAQDLVRYKALVVTSYEGEPIPVEHGGPARLLVPHLYLWKSAKWLHRIQLSGTERRGFWETGGYHNYGDPWREQRYHGD
jgi:DMSO/TMAO reductase YedYZ molybdopterin-dependent catalytic subunit